MALSTLLPFDPVQQVVMNHTSIHTLGRSLLETGPWVNVILCCLDIASFGSQTVTQLGSFFFMTEAIKLQMRIMGWVIDIVHKANDYLINADYWLRLNSDLCYDPTFKDNI
jgi:hypothetical protein